MTRSQNIRHFAEQVNQETNGLGVQLVTADGVRHSDSTERKREKDKKRKRKKESDRGRRD